MVCFALAPLGSHDRSLASEFDADAGTAEQPSDDHSTADAAELGDPMDDLELESSEVIHMRDVATTAVKNAQQIFCEVAGNTVNFDEDDDCSDEQPTDEQRELPAAGSDEQRELPDAAHSDRSPSPAPRRILIGDALTLPEEFVLAMQELLWPSTIEERDRPINLLTLESDLEPTLRVSPFDATVDVATLIVTLRQVALNRRVAEAREVPDPDAPLTREEVGWVIEFWRDKFNKHPRSQEQVARDIANGYSNSEVRHRKRSRWYSYQHRAFGNRQLGWALVTYGFNADMNVLICAYQSAHKQSDAASSPSADLRRRTLSARAWFRWGKRIDDRLQSHPESWASLGPLARSAWQGYREGWSAEQADKPTEEYGHGMLRTGARRGTFIGQQAEGSVVDRMRAALR
jgi:hypothetical protein